ncbi:MAG: alpha/beta fold hydrolase [Arachnia sp.]
MPKLTTSAGNVELHYEDPGGNGRPVVLIHGWPLSGESFAGNVEPLVAAGYRPITYDRRGFGRSGRPEEGYDYDTLASDLNDLICALDLQRAVILGFSMGGGEVARYCATYGTARLSGAILSGSICPALCITDSNPDGGMPISGFEEMRDACAADHAGFLDQFVTSFYSTAEALVVDEATRRQALALALQSDPGAAARTIMSWAEDFRDDCRRIDVPTLVIHGDGDLNVPLAASSRRAAQLIPDARLEVIAGGPHGVNVSHRDQWERALLDHLTRLS